MKLNGAKLPCFFLTQRLFTRLIEYWNFKFY